MIEKKAAHHEDMGCLRIFSFKKLKIQCLEVRNCESLEKTRQ